MTEEQIAVAQPLQTLVASIATTITREGDATNQLIDAGNITKLNTALGLALDDLITSLTPL